MVPKLRPVFSPTDLHLQISSGAASKKTEEQIWEQQRIVTQLKVSLEALHLFLASTQAQNQIGDKKI